MQYKPGQSSKRSKPLDASMADGRASPERRPRVRTLPGIFPVPKPVLGALSMIQGGPEYDGLVIKTK